MSNQRLCGWMLIGFSGVTWLISLTLAQLKQFFRARVSSEYFTSRLYYLPPSGIAITALLLLLGLIFLIIGKKKKVE